MSSIYKQWSEFAATHPDKFAKTSAGQPPPKGNLCKRCVGLSLPIFLGLQQVENIEGDYSKVRGDQGHEVANLGSPANWDHSRCSLCYLFMTIHLNKLWPADENTGYVLRAFKDFENIGLAVTVPNTTGHLLLADNASSGFISRVADDSTGDVDSTDVDVVGPKAVRLVANTVDWGHLKRMMDTPGMNESTSWEGLSLKDIPGFKLIDCETRRIHLVSDFPFENGRYAALSYVWGLGDEEPLRGNQLPTPLPKVIEDAITVVNELGIGFLWVDRYCINQADDIDKAQQFMKMHVIYSSASVIIFAAAGDGPHHGLPGISEARDANRQPCAQVSNQLLTWTMPDGPALVLRSKWNTRAWTFQEMVFAGTRLIFTDYQVYVEKRWNVFVAEAWDEYPFENISRIETHSSSTSLQSFTDILNEYSSRQLTKSSDIINALQGVLQAHAHGRGSDVVYHYWGAVIPAYVHSFDRRRDLLHPDYHFGDFQYGLSWIPTKPSTRRVGFPSWSWTGWVGKVWYITTWAAGHMPVPGFEPENMDIWIRDTGDQIVPWETIRNQLFEGRLHENLTCGIVLEAFTVQLHFEWVEDPPQYSWSDAPDPPYRAGFFVRCHDTFVTYSPVYMSGSIGRGDLAVASITFEGVVLAQMEYENRKILSPDSSYRVNSFKDLCVLVIRQREDGKTAERIGLVNLGHRIWDDECERLRMDALDSESDLPAFVKPLDLKKTKRTIELV